MALLSHFILLCLLLFPARDLVAADLMDQYLSLPGSYAFVRRTPEGATSDRVLMTVFEDFLCPACYRTVTEILPHVKEKYQNRLEIRFVSYPLVHAESRLPARAYVVSQEMGLGEQMQQALFHAHFEEQLDTASRGGLAKVAHSVGIDPELLFSRLDSGAGNTEVDQNLALGESYHIEGVPGIIFDGWILLKGLSQENIETIIDGLLERKKTASAKGSISPRKGKGSTHE